MIVAVQSVLALLIEAMLIVMSVVASSRLRKYSDLPLSWQLDGTVLQTAPRRIALALIPLVTIFVLAAVISISLFTEPRAGQAWMMVPVTLFVGFTAIGAHAFYIMMIRKLLRE